MAIGGPMKVDWIHTLSRLLRERATWYDSPEDFEAGVDALAAGLEARARSHPSAIVADESADDGKGAEIIGI